jgi:hypothetical protein
VTHASGPSILLDRVPNAVEAFALFHFLDSQGLPVRLRERPLTIALGEIPFMEAASEIYLDDPERLDEAQRLIERYRSGYAGAFGRPWTCHDCGETHEGQFGACWKCGSLRLESPSRSNPQRTKVSRSRSRLS